SGPVNGGVNPKVAQALARHSAITLTMDRYTHLYQGDLSAAVDVLPDLSCTSRQSEEPAATGTAGPGPADDAPSRSARCLAPPGGPAGPGRSQDGRSDAAPEGPPKREKPLETRGPCSGEGEIRAPGAVAGTPVFETGAFNRSATSPVVPSQ